MKWSRQRDPIAPAVAAELFPTEMEGLRLLRHELERRGIREWRDPPEEFDGEAKSKKLKAEAAKSRLKSRAETVPILLPFDPVEDLSQICSSSESEDELLDDDDVGEDSPKGEEVLWASERLDRFLAACLFARKFDLDRTIELLKNNTAWRRKWGRAQGWPTFAQVEEVASKLDMVYQVPGARGLHGGSVMYLELRKFVPSDGKFTVEQWLEYNAWFASHGALLNNLDAHRNGVIIIEDLGGMTMKNLGMGTKFTEKKAQECQNSMHDCFPMRIEKILVLNAPKFLKLLLRLAKSMGVKKKFIKRIQVLPSRDSLRDHVDVTQLTTSYGGEIEFDHFTMLRTVQAWSSEWNPESAEGKIPADIGWRDRKLGGPATAAKRLSETL
jgi:hypothetical protein